MSATKSQEKLYHSLFARKFTNPRFKIELAEFTPGLNGSAILSITDLYTSRTASFGFSIRPRKNTEIYKVYLSMVSKHKAAYLEFLITPVFNGREFLGAEPQFEGPIISIPYERFKYFIDHQLTKVCQVSQD